AGGVLTDTDTVAITVAAVNDAPVNSSPLALMVDEDALLPFTGADAISIGDVDMGGATAASQLTVSNGELSVNLAGGASISAGANNSSTLTLSGTLAQINAALATLSYQANLNFNGVDSLHIDTSDLGNSGAGGALSDSDSVAITVTAVNDAPVNSAPSAQTVDEDTVLAFTGANVISIND